MRIALLIILLGSYLHALAAAPALHPELRLELLQMEAEDQRYRVREHMDRVKADAINRTHVARLRSIVHQYGWPTISLVGPEGEQVAWLIVQHADFDPGFQKEVLNLMTPLVEQGEVAMDNYVYLYDRVYRPQRYGTQGECAGKGKWVPYPIEDAAHVDQRRESVGLEPIADYIAQVSAYFCR